MKILSIGDTHGHFVLDEIKEIMNDYDKIIFVGDYVDSFELNNITINGNLHDLISFKQQNMDLVVLLLGNHDIQYLFNNNRHRCSGYRSEIRFDLYDMFYKNKELFQMSYQIDNYLWTHAGVHTTWYNQRFNEFRKQYGMEAISDQLNTAFELYEESLFDVGLSRGGWNKVGGPFWCDKDELKSKPLENYHQIVGHTHVNDITTISINQNTSVTFIDTIERYINKHWFISKDAFYSISI